MFQIIYHSNAVWRPSDISNIEILRAAQKRNAELGITGLLLRDEMRFIQAFEGSQEAVSELFDLICRDPRHHNVQLVHFVQTDRRQFADWAMQYSDNAGHPAPSSTASADAYRSYFDVVSARLRSAA